MRSCNHLPRARRGCDRRCSWRGVEDGKWSDGRALKVETGTVRGWEGGGADVKRKVIALTQGETTERS